MTDAFDEGVKTAFVSSMMSRAGKKTLQQNRGLISDIVDDAVQRTFSSDNVSQLVRNTLKKSWAPIMGTAAGIGASTAIGASAGTYLSSRFRPQDSGPPPNVYDPSIYYRAQDAHQPVDMNMHSAPTTGVK